jgi:hypothetical protein
MPPKGKGRKSNIEAYRDAMAIVKLVDHDCMEVADAAKALGLTLSTAYRLLSRARGMLLTPQIEADKKAAGPMVNQWFEPDPKLAENAALTELLKDRVTSSTASAVDPNLATASEVNADVRAVPTAVSDPEFITLPDGTKRRIKPQEPTEDIYEWSHVMDYSSFRMKTPWRQAQLIAQWKENEALGGKHTNLRGGIKNRTCFRGCPSYQCTCEDNL